MIKQPTLFDSVYDGKPYQYKFNRYIGQKVWFGNYHDEVCRMGVIKEIKEVYTTITLAENGHERVCVSTMICPVDPEERNENV